ncbi:MAG: helix-hairpin-helix domain-containing protein [Azonexus sp.]
MTHIAPASYQTRLGENHGYRFEGDFVFLNAEVGFSDDDLAGDASWALQLWASEAGFAGGLSGVKVAEMAIQPLAGGLYAEACCTAMPPAAGGEQTLALALVAFADGRAQVRDLAVYGARHHFFLPYLGGNVSCWLADGGAELAVDSIVNPRLTDNLSGTLALEVWALDTLYAGGSWTGSPVATAILGVLAGGEVWTDCRFAVPAAMPNVGAALTVMLREWTPAGYVTRDYRNFAAAPVKAEALLAPVAEVAPVVKTKVAVDAKPAKVPAGEIKKPVGAKKPGAAKKPAKKAVASKATAKAVSVNKASEAQLSAVKGLPPSVARAIIAARPFASLEEVCKAKGMGPKMLAKLRDQFVL